MKQGRRVVVTGMGLVTPLGIGVKSVWRSLLSGECGIRAVTRESMPEEQQPAFDALPAKIAGMVCPSDLQTALDKFTIKDSPAHASFVRYALIAAAEALRDANWRPCSTADRECTGVAIGSGLSASSELATAGLALAAGKPRRISPFLIPRTLANMAAGSVSMQYDFWGPNHCASTACTSGAHSIGDAYNFIRNGDADVMVAGATEACIDAVALAGFSRMRALETRHNDSPAASCRPFDVDRGGFVIGEGAGMLVLEEIGHADARGAPSYAEVRAYGLSADAHHITQPAPDGRGAELAMQRALRASGVHLSDLAYVNAHATGTPLGDAVEARAIAKVFGLDTGNANPSVSSTKGATGHLLGAAGAVECVFCVKSLVERTAPFTLNLTKEDPQILGPALISGQSRALSDGPIAVLSNSFGFGGTNASLVFSSL